MLKWIGIVILVLTAVCGLVVMALLLHLLWSLIRKVTRMTDEITSTKSKRK